MTVVYCCLENSYGIERISAVSDNRSSIKLKPHTITVSDISSKLHSITIKCFSTDILTNKYDDYMTPYYETEFGVGYAGNCFEALNVIGNARKVFQHLIDLNSKNAKPSHSDIIRTFSSIFDEFIQSHSGKSNIAIDFLIFGYCPQSPSIPWLYKLSHRPRKKLEVTKLQINNNEIHGIGDALNNGSLVNKLKTVRRSFRRKFLKLKFYNNFEKEVFFEKMKVAQNNVTEKYIRNHINNNKNKTVGGDIEKMELYNTGQRSVVTLTIPTGSSKNNNIGELSDGLAYVPFSKNFS